VGSIILASGSAQAGGFAIREQSAVYQGLSFAGNAAGGSLSSMFWNPAATATLPGLNSESSYSLILPEATVNVKTSPFGSGSTDIADWAFVSASYWSYQLSGYSPNLFVGVGLNSPFGLVTEPDNHSYPGAVLARTTKLTTYNLNPNVAYRIAPGVVIGVGAQVEYADGTFRFATGLPGNASTAFEGNDVAFGATAGILWSPAAGTSVGLGWRSQINHTLEGSFKTAAPIGPISIDGKVDVNLPDIVTLSIQQAVSSNARILGTIEWSHWSRFNKLQVIATEAGSTVLDPTTAAGQTIATIPANWSDGWMFALGGEYDWSRQLTLRAGAAYEISPIDDPTKRIIAIPDSNRIWLSAGATWKWSESTTIDLAYTHIFLENADWARSTVTGTPETGTIDASTDIITVGMRTRWGGGAPLK
jgi:long-chain fatty acid transport protein